LKFYVDNDHAAYKWPVEGAHLDRIKFLVRDFLASVHDGTCSGCRVSFTHMKSKSRALLTDVEERFEMSETFFLRTVQEKNKQCEWLSFVPC